MPYTYEYPRPMVAADIVVVRRRAAPLDTEAVAQAPTEAAAQAPTEAATEARTEALVQVLLVRRGREPFKGSWALPGGFVEMEEDLPDAARRELREETGVEVAEAAEAAGLVELGAWGRPGRDPRGRVISVVYLIELAPEAERPTGADSPTAGDDAADARWFDLDRLPALAFDHADILAAARKHLASAP